MCEIASCGGLRGELHREGATYGHVLPLQRPAAARPNKLQARFGVGVFPFTSPALKVA